MPRVFGTPDDDFFPGSLEPDDIDRRTGNDYIFGGGGGTDTLHGSAGNDTLSGYDEPDLLCGGSRNDELYGGNQDDRLMDGAGRDVLMGQAGVDFFKGGFGDDTFVFIIEAPGNVPTADSGVGEGNCDVIEDFRLGRETIDLSSYARYRGPYQTSDAPVFLGKAAFTDSDVLHVRYDVQEDGDAVVQFLGPRPIGIGRERLLGEIELKNVGELTVENFLLGPAASDAPLGLEGDGCRGLRPDGGGSPSLRLSSVRLCAREPGGSRRGGYGAPFAPVATSQPMRPCRSCCSWSCGSLPRMEDAAEGMDRSQGSFRHSLRGPLCII